MASGNISEKIKHKAMVLIARILATGHLTTIASGTEHIPNHGPVILAARHYHHLFDGVALYLAVPRPLHIIVAIDWAANPLVRGLVEWLDRLARWPVVLRPEAIRANNSGFSNADVIRYRRTAFKNSVELLSDERVLVIFPEAYPNIDPHFTPKQSWREFLPFKEGFLTICRAAENRTRKPIPIVPVGLRYEEGKAMTAYISFGKPVIAGDFGSRTALLKEIEETVVQLSGGNDG